MLQRVVRVLKRIDNNIQRGLRTTAVKKVSNQPIQLSANNNVNSILNDVNFYDTTTLREVAILSTSRFKEKFLAIYMRTRNKGAASAHTILHHVREIKRRVRT